MISPRVPTHEPLEAWPSQFPGVGVHREIARELFGTDRMQPHS